MFRAPEGLDAVDDEADRVQQARVSATALTHLVSGALNEAVMGRRCSTPALRSHSLT
jgi:hypothetical protein